MSATPKNAGAKLQKLGDAVAKSWKSEQPEAKNRREQITGILREEWRKEREASQGQQPGPPARDPKRDRGLDR